MSAPGGWTRRLDKLDKSLPDPPAGTPYWRDWFAWLGQAYRVGDREPDYDAALRAYGQLRPPYGPEADRLHEHLLELVGRTSDGTPPCSAAEFAGLASWLAANGDALPAAGWQKAIEVGNGSTATLADLRWRAGLGPAAAGSGKLAETLRKLKARYPNGGAAGHAEGARPVPKWASSVVRDAPDAGT